jgi:hypothetical protein
MSTLSNGDDIMANTNTNEEEEPKKKEKKWLISVRKPESNTIIFLKSIFENRPATVFF